MSRINLLTTTLLIAATVLSVRVADAHDPGLSTLMIRADADRLYATVTLSPGDLTGLAGGRIDDDALVERMLTVSVAGGTASLSHGRVERGGDGDVVFELEYPHAGSPSSRIAVTSNVSQPIAVGSSSVHDR